MASPLLTIALLRAAASFEERTLLDTSPLREHVVVRAHFDAGRDLELLLPPTVRRGDRPAVTDAAGRRLTLRRGREGWIATARGAGPQRVVVRIDRVVPTPRAFTLLWPDGSAHDGRRVASFPRRWLGAQAEGWTCPGLEEAELVCVARGAAPPFSLRVSASASSRFGYLLAACSSALSLGIARKLGRDPVEALLAAAGGAAVGTSVALSLVGARLISWSFALGALIPAGALIGAIATRERSARVVAAFSLAVIPLLVALGAPVDAVVGASLLSALAIAATFSNPRTSR